MKKLLLSLLVVLMLAGCSSKLSYNVDTAQTVKGLTETTAEKIALSFNGGTTNVKLVDFKATDDQKEAYATLVSDVAATLEGVEFTAIPVEDIKETNLLFLLRNKETKAVLYFYSDGNAKIAQGVETGYYKLTEEVTTKANDIVKAFLEANTTTAE